MTACIPGGWALLCLTACAALTPPLTPAMEPRLAVAEETLLQARVLSLAAPVLTANARHCPQTHPFTGLVTTHLADWPGAGRDELDDILGADHHAAVWIVADASPAARAGLLAGDTVRGLNGRWSEPNARWHDDFRARTFPAALGRGETRLRVQRGQQILNVVLTPQPACAAHVRLVSIDLEGARRQPVWIAGDTLFIDRAFAAGAPDPLLQQFTALALARHIGRHQSLPAPVMRALQGPDIVRFAFGLDAMDQLAGRGPEQKPPRRRRPSGTQIRLAALLLLQAQLADEAVYASAPGSSRASAPPNGLASASGQP